MTLQNKKAAASPKATRAIHPSDAVLERLTRLHPKIIDLSLDRVRRLLARLDHPEEKLSPVVHVAGTNGKGSVIAFLRAMLEASGARVQAYTSPHLVRFHERIRLSHGLIDEAELIEILELCEARNGTAPITYFEITTAAAFLAFSRDPADIVLLETGLGGRLDATNVLRQPRLTVITPVSIDHVQYLGSDLEQMALEKAGILKPGVPAVIGPQPESVLGVIERRAAELGAPLHRFGKEWRARAKEGGFVFQGRSAPRDYPRPVLTGRFQIENAATALACADLLEGFALDRTARRAGLARARWPGRLQRLCRGPLVALLPEAWELWLDGGHNPGASHALAETLAQWRDRPLHLVLGMLEGKDLGGFLKPLAPLVGRVQTVAIIGAPASLSAEQAAAEAKAIGIAAHPSPDLDSALGVVAARPDPGRILICGSLYLAGQVLAENG